MYPLFREKPPGVGQCHAESVFAVVGITSDPAVRIVEFEHQGGEQIVVETHGDQVAFVSGKFLCARCDLLSGVVVFVPDEGEQPLFGVEKREDIVSDFGAVGHGCFAEC